MMLLLRISLSVRPRSKRIATVSNADFKVASASKFGEHTMQRTHHRVPSQEAQKKREPCKEAVKIDESEQMS